MSLFEKCKENKIDGRRVYVCSKVVGYIEVYNKWIVKICASRKVAKFFPTLWFSLERSLDEKLPAAYIIDEELVEGIAKIHINPSKIPDFKTFEAYVLHELTHLWQDYLVGWARKSRKSALLLSQATKKLLLKELQGTPFPNLRSMLHFFIWSLHLEGVAAYVQYFTEGRILFTEAFFLDNYQISRREAQKLNELFVGLSREFNVQRLKSEIIAGLRGPEYTIGPHMVYSLLYLNKDLNLKKIAKMNPFTFIKKYEACMLERGYQPAVSLTSGAGYFDYKKSVEQWWKAVKS